MLTHVNTGQSFCASRARLWRAEPASTSSVPSPELKMTTESRVAGPNHSHFAPKMDCSMLDTCTLCYTRIAPWLTPSTCVARGSLRVQHLSASHRAPITPCSTLGIPCPARIAPCLAFLPCAAHGSLRVQHFPLHAEPGLLRAPHFALCTVHRLLRARHLAFGSERGLLHARPLVPCTGRGSLRVQHLALRTAHELLRARHLAFHALPGLLRARHFLPCVARGLLRAQHLACVHRTRIAPLPTHFDASLRVQITPHSTLGILDSTQIAPCSVPIALSYPRIAPCSTLSAS